jgi:hypothetical protein
VSCCSEYDAEALPTVRHLIHDLSSPWVDPNKPVTLELYAPGLGLTCDTMEIVITGVTTTARGQSLDYIMREQREAKD